MSLWRQFGSERRTWKTEKRKRTTGSGGSTMITCPNKKKSQKSGKDSRGGARGSPISAKRKAATVGRKLHVETE